MSKKIFHALSREKRPKKVDPYAETRKQIRSLVDTLAGDKPPESIGLFLALVLVECGYPEAAKLVGGSHGYRDLVPRAK